MKDEEAPEAAEFVVVADKGREGRNREHHRPPETGRRERLEEGRRDAEQSEDVLFDDKEAEAGDTTVAERRLQHPPADPRGVFLARYLEGAGAAADMDSHGADRAGDETAEYPVYKRRHSTPPSAFRPAIREMHPAE